jgi:acyl carrier protein
MNAQREAAHDQLVAFLDSIKRPGAQVAGISRSESLVRAGLIDSLAMLQIVLYLETTYGIDFSATGLDPEKLGTLDGILDIIENHRK